MAIDYLDKSVAVSTIGGRCKFFEQLITNWEDSKTVAQQVHRAAMNDTFAWLRVQQARAQQQLAAQRSRVVVDIKSTKRTSTNDVESTLTDIQAITEPLRLVADKPLDWKGPTAADVRAFQAIWDETPSKLSRAVKRTADLAWRVIHRLLRKQVH